MTDVRAGGGRPDVYPWWGRTDGSDGRSTNPTTTGARAVIRARFRLALREGMWVTTVSTRFPDATLRLLTGVPMGDRALELGEVRADDPEPVAEAIRDHPDISEYEPLWAGEGRAIAQYEAVEQGLYEFLWASSLPPEFPIVVENGVMEFDLTATRSQFEAVGDALDASDQAYELLSVVHAAEGEALLTERQRECVTTALHMGYFEVPRGTTLAAVAEALDIDKSTASETIRRGTARVMAQFLLGGDPS
ncbi:helix-turn-helix domain-containing protein [Haloarcula onubensis]|uniref:Helix-turn-helix domain-containing protein n=1 Tax=Haloarcula onubensis TaxID=2950539 RepID=A0ABU2FP25_9EURY|nr:helix-turn-helix domain-containing protein [Halomicroarcula sp. S3CR25-11]MDS0282505.1 helix-turn-helix domain-containing protein [Halomicroarcula sp. S3CR25-11]